MKWQVLDRKLVFDAAPFVQIHQERVRLADGREIDDYFQVKMPDFALIVPLMQDGRILMLRQYKHGPGRVSLTFPAGHVEPGEAPELAAQREFLEETGCDAASWQKLGEFVDHGNQYCATGHYYLAQGCRRVKAAASGDLEEMQEVFLTPKDLDQAMFDGGFAIAHHVVGWALARAKLAL